VGWKKRIGRRRRLVSDPGDRARFTVEATGESMVVKDPVDFKCPFCGGNVVVVAERHAVMRSMPMCEKFDKEDPLVFLRNARMVVVGKMPDDDEWPISPSSDGKRN